MASVFANTRFAFLAKRSSSVSTDEPSVASSSTSSSHTMGRALPRENRTAFKTIWLLGAFMAIFMPLVVRCIRMNTDHERYQQEDGSSATSESSRALHFVYAWQIVMFLIMTAYGYNVIHGQKSHETLMGALLVWWQYNLLAMLLLSYSIEGRGGMEMEVFYGQFSVLMFMTNAWYVVHGLIFCFLFAIRGVVAKQKQQQQQQRHRQATVDVDEETSKKNKETDHTYQRMDDAPPSPTGNTSGGETDYIIVI